MVSDCGGLLNRLIVLLLASCLSVASQAQTLASFETDFEVAKPQVDYKFCTVSRGPVGATSGSSAAQVAFQTKPTDYPFFTATLPAVEDLSDNGLVGLDVTNTGPQTETFYFQVYDENGKKLESFFSIRAGETRSCAFILSDLSSASAYGLRGLPAVHDGFYLIKPTFPVGFLKNRITKIGIYVKKPVNPIFFSVDNIRATPSFTWTSVFTGGVDRFGQRTWGGVPGKVATNADLVARLIQEASALDAAPAFADRTARGSWATGPTLPNSSGYFRTVKYNGKWYFLDPAGKLFWSTGLDTIDSLDLPTPTQGREYMFQWLPQPADPEYPFLTTQTVNGSPTTCFDFIAANILRKYGDTEATWIPHQLKRMSAWGFNTVGSFSWLSMWQRPNLPYVICLNTDSSAKFFSVTGATRQMPDVFDATWPTKLEAKIQEYVTFRNVNTDPNLIGYFTDNELPFTAFADEFAMVRSVLAKSSTSLAAKEYFVARMQKRYDTIDQLNTAWGTAFTSWDDLKLAKTVTSVTAGFQADARFLIRAFAQKYYSTWRTAIRKYDANHLYLGSKCNQNFTMDMVDVMQQYCDVLSFTCYAPQLTAKYAVLSGSDRPLIAKFDTLIKFDKPIMLSEYDNSAVDRSNFAAASVDATVDTQALRAIANESMLRSCLANKLFVGAHFFKLYDDPVFGNTFQGLNNNMGICDVTDTPYPEMVEMFMRVHKDIYNR